jgi:hypothetical protein
MRAAIALAMLASLASGCQIYLGDDDPPPPCDTPTIPPTAPLLLLDPSTGECVQFDLGGPICDPDSCNCAWLPIAPPPSWAPCDSACSLLDEYTCMATSGCRATYRGEEFHACFATDQTGPVQGECAGLDAWSCSIHDDCVAVHEGGVTIALDPIPTPPPLGWFRSCDSEPTPCYDYGDGDDIDMCQPGEHCNARDVCLPPPACDDAIGICAEPDYTCGGFCVPDDRGTCFGEVFCEVVAPECPPGSTPGVRNGCYTFECIPLGECPSVPFEECHGQPACDAIPPECPEGHVPQQRGGCWTGACIPLELCEQEPQPGSCIGQVVCRALPPDCAAGSVPGIANGCFDGTCIPLDECGAWPPAYFCGGDVQCESEPPSCPEGYEPLNDGLCWTDICAPLAMCQPQPVCADLTDEDACLSTSGCTPVYTGVDCTCSPAGCDCQSWAFDRCQ